MLATVTASGLHLRATPGGRILATLPRGTQVEVLADAGHWVRVRVPGSDGFVHADFLDRARPRTPAGVPPAAGPGEVRVVGNDVIGPGGVRFARKVRRGLKTDGTTTVRAFLAEAGGERSSLHRILEVVSGNEGHLEAINSYDNAFLSFGIFQWTAGAGGAAGELGALLHRLRASAPEAFREYFGTHALDVCAIQEPKASVGTGLFSLEGRVLRSAEAKEVLRSPDWGYRFWRAGHDTSVRRAQVEHAASRIPLFYGPKLPDGRAVADYVTSELGVALLLDEHVNRPGHVPATLLRALRELGTHVDIARPEAWQDGEESALLDRYLELRSVTNMTHAGQRGETLKAAAARGLLSTERHSFQA